MNSISQEEEHLMSEYKPVAANSSEAIEEGHYKRNEPSDDQPILPQYETRRETGMVVKGWEPIPSDSASFIPGIEGLRGIAVVMTMYCHIVDQPYVVREVAGTMGVTIFFVLSGFLITGVLIRLQDKERAKGYTSRFSMYRHLGRFYMDRTVRLLPALVFMLATSYALYYYTRYNEGRMRNLRGYALLSVFYLSNFQSLWPQHGNTGPYGQTWSLACEEQYYIGWAFVLPLILKLSMRYRGMILMVLIGISLYARVITGMYHDAFFGAHWRFGLVTNVYKMFVGSALRMIPVPPILRKPIMTYIGLVGLAIVLLVCDGPRPEYHKIAPGWHDLIPPITTWTDPVSTLLTIPIITGLHGSSSRNWLLESRILRFWGKISYSWYLWQITLMNYSGWKRVWPAVGDTNTALVVAMFSTYMIEEPLSQWYKSTKAKK